VKDLFTNHLFVRVDEISALGIMRGGPFNAKASIGGATFSVNDGQFEFQIGAAMSNKYAGAFRVFWVVLFADLYFFVGNNVQLVTIVFTVA
jgi:hypothetical protein